MGVDREDEHFLQVMTRSMARIEGGEFLPATEVWRREAVNLLTSAREALQAFVEREDIEEIEAEEALQILSQSRRDLDARCFDILAALDIRLGELRLAHQQGMEELRPLAQFLNRYHEGEFESLRHVAALSQARHAYALGIHWSADEEVCQALDEAANAFESAREAAAKEGAEAVSAYGELVEGRSLARICYLSARDLLSAALRFEGRHDELEELMPPLSIIFRVGFA